MHSSSLARLTIVLALVFTILSYTSYASIVTGSATNLPGSQPTHHRPIESHHSLSNPFDAHTVYWKFGGSSVMTKKYVRLTPATQDRRGWLWNDFPIDAEEFEVELTAKVSSKSHFGGDGFGLWFLHKSMDPAMHAGSYLSGPLVGLRADFHGVGIIFDTYDNDNMRDNPLVLVVKNFPAHPDEAVSDFQFNHNLDFSQDMIRDSPANVFKCTADYRNTLQPFKVLVRYQREVLHVYIDKGDYVGFQFCLSVNLRFPSNTKGQYHLAMTALTGQLADIHDVFQIHTRTLDNRDALIDDDQLTRISDGSWLNWAYLFWLLVLVLATGLAANAVWELLAILKVKSSQVKPFEMCEKINALILPHMCAHALITFFMLITGHWLAFFFNLPVVGYRLSCLSRNKLRVDVAQLSEEDDFSLSGLQELKYKQRVYGAVIFYVLSVCYYLTRLSAAS